MYGSQYFDLFLFFKFIGKFLIFSCCSGVDGNSGVTPMALMDGRGVGAVVGGLC